MSAVKFIVSVVLMFVFLYFTITSVQNVMTAQEDVKKAEREVELAAAEAAEARKEFDNVLKYNCANPMITSGVMSCPEDLPPATTNEPALKTESSQKGESDMPGCTVTGEDNTGKANSWSCP